MLIKPVSTYSIRRILFAAYSYKPII